MPYLIDGHNLIGQMSSLSLDDPDDELKLVRQLKRFCARERRTATVIFDRGLVGGKSRELSGGGVTVIFAPSHAAADDLLLRRIRDERNPNGLIVVSSDQQIVRAARQRRMTVKASAEFEREMAKALSNASTDSEKSLSESEVAEWEALFKSARDDS